MYIRSHFRKWPWRDWQPLYCVGCEVLVCLCRCVGLLRSLLMYWYLGSQKLREILTLLYCITLSSSRKTNASSKRSKKDFWRRCLGGLRSSQDIPSTHHKLISLALHYFPFSSRFPLPHFTLPVLFASLFRSPFVCSLSWPARSLSLRLPTLKFSTSSKDKGKI